MPSPLKNPGVTPFEAAYHAPGLSKTSDQPQDISRFRRTLSAAFRTTEDLGNIGSNSVWEHSDDDSSTRGIRSGVQSSKAILPIGGTRRAIIMVALCLSNFLTGLEMALISTALPAIEDEILVSTTQYSWIGAAYIVAGVCLLPLWRTISEIFSRKWTLVAGLAMYIAGCLIAALAKPTYQLIAGRAVQGIGGYSFFELGSAALADITTPAKKRRSQALVFGCMCLGASASTLLGGLFSEYADWRCNFWFCLAVAVPSFLSILLCFPSSIPTQRARKRSLVTIDFPGASLAGAGTILFLLGLQFGGLSYPWDSGNVIGLLTAGLACLLGFFAQQYFAMQPILQYGIFNDLTRAASMFVAFAHGFTYIAGLYYLPLYFHLVLSANYAQIGVWLSATAIPAGVVAFSAAAIIKNTGHYRLIVFVGTAALTMAIGFFMTFPANDRDWVRLIFFQLMLSLGVGALFPALRIIMQKSVHADKAIASISALEFIRGLGSVFGIVAGQVLLQNQIRTRSAVLRSANLPNDREDSLSTDWSAFSDTARLTPEKQVLMKEVFTRSMKQLWIMYTVVTGIALIVGFCIRNQRKRPHLRRYTTPENHEMMESNGGDKVGVVVTNSSSG